MPICQPFEYSASIYLFLDYIYIYNLEIDG